MKLKLELSLAISFMSKYSDRTHRNLKTYNHNSWQGHLKKSIRPRSCLRQPTWRIQLQALEFMAKQERRLVKRFEKKEVQRARLAKATSK